MKRSEVREATFKILFGQQFHSVEDVEQQCELFFDEKENAPNIFEKQKTYIISKVKDIVEKSEELDNKINEVTVGWNTKTIGKVELIILRLAIFELDYEDDIPSKVTIDEAVELAKKYGEDTSPKFINGILAKLV